MACASRLIFPLTTFWTKDTFRFFIFRVLREAFGFARARAVFGQKPDARQFCRDETKGSRDGPTRKVVAVAKSAREKEKERKQQRVSVFPFSQDIISY